MVKFAFQFLLCAAVAMGANGGVETPGWCFGADSLRSRNVSGLVISMISNILQDASRDSVVGMQVHTGSQGFGVQFVSYYSAFSHAIRSGRLFKFEGSRWNYASDSHCTAALPGLTCYFDEVLCSRVQEALTNDASPPGTTEKHTLFTGRSNLVVSGADSLSREMQWHYDMLEPPPWAQERGSRWWEGQMALSLFCLRPRVLREGQRWEKQVGFSSSSRGACISVHIRRRDRKDLHKYNLQDYMAEVLDIHRLHGTSTIYLSSDDADVRAEAKRWAAYHPRFRLFFRTAPQDESDEPHKRSRYMAKQATKAYTTAMLLDLHFLSECNYFVGAQRSMFAWVASRLMVGKGHERACPRWIGGDTSNKYGWWRSSDNLPGGDDCV